jgi:hypothetical protein
MLQALRTQFSSRKDVGLSGGADAGRNETGSLAIHRLPSQRPNPQLPNRTRYRQRARRTGLRTLSRATAAVVADCRAATHLKHKFPPWMCHSGLSDHLEQRSLLSASMQSAAVLSKDGVPVLRRDYHHISECVTH